MSRNDLPTDTQPFVCPHCAAAEPSVWDLELECFSHPSTDHLKVCHSPWRARCRRCSRDVPCFTDRYCAVCIDEEAAA